MYSKSQRIGSIAGSLLVFAGLSLTKAPTVCADDVYRGHLEGEGTYFEVTDSEYLNVTVHSTESISIWLDSAPEIVSMEIAPLGGAVTTWMTISGLPPQTTLHKYQDGFDDHVVFTTDASGTYGFEQGLSESHHVFIQTTEGTWYIRDDATGGDCVLIGAWDWATKTCTLTTDVYETIYILDDGITLDGAGHAISTSDLYGVYRRNGTGVSITGCVISNSNRGIYAYGASSCTFTGNTITNNSAYGISADYASWCTFTGNTISSSYRGIWSRRASSCTFEDNTIFNNIGLGIYANAASSCTFTGNTISDNSGYGIHAEYNSLCSFTGNTISNSNRGIWARRASSCTFTGNTISDNIGLGIYAYVATSCTFTGNTISNHSGYGIHAEYASLCTLTDNTISNSYRGIFARHASSCTFTGNTISNNSAYGIYAEYASSNTLFHNDFIDNTTHVHPSDGGSNTFYEPNLLEGNYWSDYPGYDDGSGTGKHAILGDGIGDTHLPWHGDEYPFMFESGYENTPPTCVVDRGPFVVTADVPFTLELSAEDPDGDDLDVTADGMPVGATLTPESGGPSPLTVTFDWTPTDADKAAAPYDIAVTFTDPSGAGSTCSFSIADVNLPPVCDAGDTLIVEAEGPDGALVTLSASASDPDDPPETLMYHWDAPVPLDDPNSPVASGVFPIAQSIAILTVTDGRGGLSVCAVTVVVQDSTPPEVRCVTSTAALWPPNHRMREVTITVAATDACADPDFVFPLVATIRSNEADDAQGSGDGHTTGDVNAQDGYTTPVVVTNCFTWDPSYGDDGAWIGTVTLRAERDGNGDGRAYIIEVEATDSNFNIATTTAVVVVPHDRRGGGNNG